jgi:hypothetical protein
MSTKKNTKQKAKQKNTALKIAANPRVLPGQLPVILRNEIADDIEGLKKLETDLGKADKNRATFLFKIFCKFQAFGTSTSIEGWDSDDEFYLFISEQFSLQRNQCYLYIRISRHPELRNANVSVSRSEILMNYNREEIRLFRETYTDEMISDLTVRLLSLTIEDFFAPKNPSPKPTKPENSDIKNPDLKIASSGNNPALDKALAFQETLVQKQLKAAFDKVKKHFKNKDISMGINQTFQDMFAWKSRKDSELETEAA